MNNNFKIKDLESAWIAGRAHFNSDLTFEKYLENKNINTENLDVDTEEDLLNINCFMVATNNNLDMLYKFMFSPLKGARYSNLFVAEFIKDVYEDDYFLRRELLKIEKYVRANNKNV